MNLFDVLFTQQTSAVKPNEKMFDILFAKKLQSAMEKLVTIIGNPLSFTTKKAQLAKSTKISMEPIQDLHGYDYPWPEGEGVNLFNVNDVSLIELETASRYGVIINDPGTYTLKCYNVPSTSNFRINARLKHENSWDNVEQIVYNTTTRTVTLTISDTSTIMYIYAADGSYLEEDAKAVFINSQFQVSKTNVAPDKYYSYSNICPISGRTQVSLNGCGKNLWNLEDFYSGNATVTKQDDGSYTLTGRGYNIVITYNVKVKPNQLVWLKGTFNIISGSGSTIGAITVYDGNTGTKLIDNKKIETPRSIIPTKDYIKIYLTVSGGYGWTTSVTNDAYVIQDDNIPSYEPYEESNKITISFGEEVYGCTLDVEKGELVVDKIIAVFNSLSSISNITANFVGTSNELYSYIWLGAVPFVDTTNLTGWSCSHFKNAKVNSQTTDFGCYVYHAYSSRPNDTVINFRNKNIFNTLAKCKEWFTEQMNNGTPVQCWFTLATPRTISLTPEQVQLLKGVNNLWTDGDSIELTYKE